MADDLSQQLDRCILEAKARRMEVDRLLQAAELHLARSQKASSDSTVTLEAQREQDKRRSAPTSKERLERA